MRKDGRDRQGGQLANENGFAIGQKTETNGTFAQMSAVAANMRSYTTEMAKSLRPIEIAPDYCSIIYIRLVSRHRKR